MANLAASKKTKHTKSEFQKLWDKADRLKRQNERLRIRLDELLVHADAKIRPVEKESAISDIPLLKKLLTLGQRKSLARWEREVLDNWIRNLIADMHTFGLLDMDLQEAMARYDAFRLGVELEESDNDDHLSAYEQMASYMADLNAKEREEAKKAEENARRERKEDLQTLDEMISSVVESKLDAQLGPPPTQPDKHHHTIDLLQDDLIAELQRLTNEYNDKREKLREELLGQVREEMRTEFGSSLFDDVSDDSWFDEEFDDTYIDSFEPTTPKIDNSTFKRMFRATAARLHPDREPDLKKRAEKQKLMATLLAARKTGDLLTVFKLYQQHADHSETFSNTDEKQLIDALRNHVEQLEDEKDEIVFQSPMHHLVFVRFYHVNKKKQERAIKDYVRAIRADMAKATQRAKSITSIKSLKPFLQELRYDSTSDMMLDLLASMDIPEESIPF